MAVSPKHSPDPVSQFVSSFGEWIKRRSEHLGLKQKALARLCGCSVAWIKKIEQDKNLPGEELAGQLAEALAIPPPYRPAFIHAARTRDLSGLPPPATLESLPTPPTPRPLPPQPTHFFGRTRELSEIDRLLADPSCRMVTLLGPGGIGKTRLALQAAEHQRAVFDVVHFVSLCEVTSGTLVAQAIADALQLPRLAQSDPTLQIAAYLREVAPKTLLILDNFEHLLDGVTFVDELLEHTRGVKVLVTSRERLRSKWECSVELEGLEWPPEGTYEGLESYTSVQLFAERARRAFPHFPFKNEVKAVARICRLVQGHPLAVELAAAWVAVYDCGEIAEQIESNIELLKKQRNHPADAHRSVAAAFDYSYALLSADEQRVFRMLGVFGGGFDWEAAVQVAGAGRRTLTELADKSLLQREGRRFNLHELLRRYAAEKLAEHPDQAQDAEARMFRYYLDYARAHRQDYEQLELEWGNLNAGLGLARRQNDWQAVVDYVAVLQVPWERRARFSDARQAYRLALEAVHARGDLRAEVGYLREWGKACIEQGDYVEAERHLTASVDLARKLEDEQSIAHAQIHLARIAIERAKYGVADELLMSSLEIESKLDDKPGLADALYQQALCRYYQGEIVQAIKLLQSVLSLRQELNDRIGRVRALRQLAEMALAGAASLEQAIAYCTEALQLAQEVGEQGEHASALRTLSEIHRQQKDYETARDYAEHSLSAFRFMGDRKSQAQMLFRLSWVYTGLNNLAAARDRALKSLELCQELQDNWGTVYVLSHLGDIFVKLNEAGRARELWTAGLRMAQEVNHPCVQSLQDRLASG